MSPCSPQTPQHTDAPGSSAGNWCLSASCINLAATQSKQEGSTTALSSGSLGAGPASVPPSSTSKSPGWSASTCLSTCSILPMQLGATRHKYWHSIISCSTRYSIIICSTIPITVYCVTCGVRNTSHLVLCMCNMVHHCCSLHAHAHEHKFVGFWGAAGKNARRQLFSEARGRKPDDRDEIVGGERARCFIFISLSFCIVFRLEKERTRDDHV